MTLRILGACLLSGALCYLFYPIVQQQGWSLFLSHLGLSVFLTLLIVVGVAMLSHK